MSWRRFLKRDYWDRERAGEIESYIEIETADNLARGMTPGDAAAAARRKLGNPVPIREEIYRMNSISWLESIVQDVRYGGRLLLRNPGFACVAILSLALGIGANTAIFQLLNAVRLRSLPVPNPQELAEIRILGGNGGMGMNGEYGELTQPIRLELFRNHPAFSSVMAWSRNRAEIGDGKDFQLADGANVSGNFFQVLGVPPWRGRLLVPEDEHACPGNTAVVSYGWWQNKMGGRAIDANTKLLIDGEPRHIVGVMPPWFSGVAVGERFDIALPYCRPQELARNVFDTTVMGRLRPGWTVEKASAQLAAMSPGIMAATEPGGYSARTIQNYRNFRLAAYPAATGVSNLRKQYDSSLWLLLAITGLVLLIACANLANLMLARAGTRRREIAVRLALGAARLRLLRQLLVESVLLAAIGALLGVGLAQLLSRVLLVSLSTDEGAVNLVLGTDWHVLIFAAGVAALTCIVFGVAPALRASGADPVSAMKAGGRNVTTNREGFSIQRALVVTQISVSLVLLTGALLFVRSFRNLATFDPGVREEGISLAFISFQKSHIPENRLKEFQQQLLEDIRSTPGVLNAAITTVIPLTGNAWSHHVTTSRTNGSSMFTWISPGYFDTMGVPLLRGRNVNEGDTGTSPRVAVVNEMFVRQYLSGVSPLGQTMRTSPEPDYPSTDFQVVGVIPDTKYANLRDATPPMAFVPAAQFEHPRPWTSMVIRSGVPPEAAINSMKRRMGERHPEVIAQFRVYQRDIRNGLVRERLMATLSGFFGLLAAALGMIGLYGVISYMVTRRGNEIGIRIALGASRGQVLGMVMREAGWLLAIGIGIGTVLSLVAARGAEALLFGLKPNDPLTLGAAAGLLIAISTIASYVPARRAAGLNPMDALRCE